MQVITPRRTGIANLPLHYGKEGIKGLEKELNRVGRLSRLYER